MGAISGQVAEWLLHQTVNLAGLSHRGFESLPAQFHLNNLKIEIGNRAIRNVWLSFLYRPIEGLAIFVGRFDSRGCSSTVELQPSKLVVAGSIPSPALADIGPQLYVIHSRFSSEPSKP